jgi:hypothetical protein
MLQPRDRLSCNFATVKPLPSACVLHVPLAQQICPRPRSRNGYKQTAQMNRLTGVGRSSGSGPQATARS